jgi:hypothetical protein
MFCVIWVVAAREPQKLGVTSTFRYLFFLKLPERELTDPPKVNQSPPGSYPLFRVASLYPLGNRTQVFLVLSKAFLKS